MVSVVVIIVVISNIGLLEEDSGEMSSISLGVAGYHQ
jgi:hypothetical protein